jgi:hypothetical protein
VLAWWLTLKPSNDGNWQPDTARTARTEIDADHNSQFTQLRPLVERDGALDAALCSVGVFSRTPKRGSARHGRKQRMTASELVENACVPHRFQQVFHLSASGQNSRATVKGHERRQEEGGRTLVLGLETSAGEEPQKDAQGVGVRLSWGCPGFLRWKRFMPISCDSYPNRYTSVQKSNNAARVGRTLQKWRKAKSGLFCVVPTACNAGPPPCALVPMRCACSSPVA